MGKEVPAGTRDQDYRRRQRTFVKSITNLVNGMLDKIKALLGIHSPSDVLADEVGENMPQGIGVGFERRMPDLKRRLAQSMMGLVNTLNVNVPGANVGLSGSQLATAGAGFLWAISTWIRVAPNPKAVGQAVGDAVLKKIRSLGGM